MTAAAAAQRPPVLAPPTPAPPQAPALTAVARPARLRCPVRPTLLPSFWNWRHSAARSNGSRCGAPRGAPVGRRPGGPPGRTVGNADVGSVTSATCGRQSLFLRGWSGVDIHPFIHWRSHRRLRQLYPRFLRQDRPARLRHSAGFLDQRTLSQARGSRQELVQHHVYYPKYSPRVGGPDRRPPTPIWLAIHRGGYVVRYGPRSALGAAMVESLLDGASHGPAGRWVLLCPTRQPASCFSGTTVMGLPAGTAGLKRHISITMEFASRTISPVPDISRYVH